MNFFEKTEVNTGRQIEVDFMKAVCILGMVGVHCFEQINYNSTHSEGIEYILVIVLDCLFGASSFMFCMGLGIAYARNNTPKGLMKRGVQLFSLAYLLNIIRGVIPLCVVALSLKNYDCLSEIPSELVDLDILHFAGLAMLLFGFLKKFKHHMILLPAVAILLSAIGSFIRTIDMGNFWLNQLVGIFIGTAKAGEETQACFPLFNWFIFVVAGYFFGTMFRYCKDKKHFYKCFGILAWAITIIYMCIAIPNKIGIMGTDMNKFYHMTTLEAFVCCIATISALSLYYLISSVLSQNFLNWTSSISKNINSIYCIHWVLLDWIWYPFRWGMDISEMPTAFVLCFAVALCLVSTTIADFYQKRREK